MKKKKKRPKIVPAITSQFHAISSAAQKTIKKLHLTDFFIAMRAYFKSCNHKSYQTKSMSFYARSISLCTNILFLMCLRQTNLSEILRLIFKLPPHFHLKVSAWMLLNIEIFFFKHENFQYHHRIAHKSYKFNFPNKKSHCNFPSPPPSAHIQQSRS